MSSVKIEPVAREDPAVPSPVAAPVLAPPQHSGLQPPQPFQNHSHAQPEGPGDNRTSTAAAALASHPAPTHGYSHAPLQQGEAYIHPELRSAHDLAPPPGYAHPPAMIPAGVPPPPEQVAVMSGPTAGIVPTAGMMDNGETADGRKKRELSQSKRAAQNRAAQRAFRQRKEGYIKKLEQQVQEFHQMEESYKAMQAENFQLREYIIHLQSRLLESQGDYPPPPANVNLAHPNASGRAPEAPSAQPPPGVGVPGSHSAPPPQPQQVPAPNPLEVAAQAVAGLSRSEHRPVDPYAGLRAVAMRNEAEDANTAEQITRQLQADGAQENNLPEATM